MPGKRKAGAEPPAPTAPPPRAANALTRFFGALKPGPADAGADGAAPDPGRAVNIFATNAERIHRKPVKIKGVWKSAYLSYACADGTLKGGCMHPSGCPRAYVDIMYFAPAAGSSHSAAARQKFEAALAAYAAAYAAGDKEEAVAQRALVEAHRTALCTHCNKAGQLSPTERACKERYEAFRREAAEANDGCANPGCYERGAGAWCVLQGDHGTNPKKKNAHGKPIGGLGDYMQWAVLGTALAREHGKTGQNAGLPFALAAMDEEWAQIHQWICACCHKLEPTGSTGRRHPDPERMPAGKSAGTAEQVKQYHARLIASITVPKYQHVDARKRAIGYCAACKCPVQPGEEVAFDFNHRVESTKTKGGLFGKYGGVAGLVNNCRKAASLEQVRDLLDAEMAKCDLLCCNCHHRHTHGYEPRAPVA